MPYVHRNEQGQVMRLLESPSIDGDEWLELEHGDVITFMQQSEQASELKKSLHTSDVEMARVLEDVVDLLMAKQVFTFTELPEVVQDKLNRRKTLRQEVNDLSDLITEEESIL